jgi:hypothetical protein
VIRKRHGQLVDIDVNRLANDVAQSHAHLDGRLITEGSRRDLEHEVERWSERLSSDA